MIEITIGAPIRAVTAFIGRFPSNPGSLAIMLQNSVMTIPINIDIGTRSLWSLLLNKYLAMCGTESPINEIGPQYAVVMAVR